ncbi:hypothetical protein [Kutzneria buriramensis]|nr:hypothetical protein [Kutzneria buriramensis]
MTTMDLAVAIELVGDEVRSRYFGDDVPNSLALEMLREGNDHRDVDQARAAGIFSPALADAHHQVIAADEEELAEAMERLELVDAVRLVGDDLRAGENDPTATDELAVHLARCDTDPDGLAAELAEGEIAGERAAAYQHVLAAGDEEITAALQLNAAITAARAALRPAQRCAEPQ